MSASLIVRAALLALLPPLLAPGPGTPPWLAALAGIAPAVADDDGPGGRDDFADDRGGPDPGRDPFIDREPPMAADPEREPRTPRDYAADEVLATGLSAGQVDALRNKGYAVLEERRLGAVGLSALRLKIPRGTALRRALQDVRALAPGSDLNHFYRAQDAACNRPECNATKLLEWPGSQQPCAAEPVIGVIDTGIDRDHPALRGSRLDALVVRGAGRAPSGKAHGTAVASILAGAADGRAPGLLPRARVVAVDAFHRGSGGEDRMDAFDLAAAIDALLARGVKLINLSFAGPPNELLAAAIRAASGRKVLLVAAAGNDGPNADPRYPAAYEGVLAVTAVAGDLRVYRRAGRGAHIALAAPGVDVWAARAGGSGERAYQPYSGTSFAAPYVTAVSALLLAHRHSPESAARALTGGARDLGAPGRDPVFGHGLVRAPPSCGGAGARQKNGRE
jgi:hypothetical protein